MPKGRYAIMLNYMPQGRQPRPRHDAAHLHHPGQSRLCLGSATWRTSSASASPSSRSPPRCSPIRRSPKASPTASSPSAAISGRTPIPTAPACSRSCSRTASATSAISITRSTCRCISCSATATISTSPASRFRDFLDGRLPGLPGEKPRVSDFTDHLSTIFPEVRLKSFLEMRGADGGPWSRICALPALWVGLLYDDDALAAAWDEVKHWSLDGAPGAARRGAGAGPEGDDAGRRDRSRSSASASSPSPRRASTRAPGSTARATTNRASSIRCARCSPRARPRPSGCSSAIMARGMAISPASTRRKASDGRRPVTARPPHPLPADRALRDRPASTSATATASIGSAAARRAPSRPSSSTAAPAPAAAPTIAASSIPRATTSSCSTSAAAAARRRTPRSRPTPPGIWSTISSGCARWPGIERWLVFGGSWGSTLALAYAQTHPDARHRAGAARHLHLPPERAGLALRLWRLGNLPRQMAGIPRADPGRRSAATSSPPTSAASPATTGPSSSPPPRRGASGRRRRSPCSPTRTSSRSSPTTISRSPSPASRIITWSTRAGSRKASCSPARRKLKGIPGVIVQGRYDCCTPPSTAWDLHQAWPEAELVIVPDGGHLFNEPGVLDGLIRATDAFARLSPFIPQP